MATALAACGDSGGDTNSASNSNSNSAGEATTDSATDSDGTGSASMSATEPTEGGMSASGTGTTDQSGGMSDGETMGGGSGNETEGMSGGTGQNSEGGSGGSTTMMTTEPEVETTGEPVDCSEAQTKEDCLALDCMPIEGQAFEFDGAIWCLNQNKSFLGCLPQMGCDDAITTVCKGQNTYQLPNGCFPDDYSACEPPPDPNMDGYPTC